ncbi:MAG: MOSC domain-containing protein [Phycisphaerales bacterium]|nr:MOSC domain-containing protein [Phycisphaerales bacterium]PHX77326.1 MAG: MOSC domain-containing protein [Planctomycetaceae bacterium]
MTADVTTPTSGTNHLVVDSLHVYPLKGAAGFSPQSWPVDERGLRHDRRFMVVDADGVFISQRTNPRMALIRGEIAGDGLRISTAGGMIDVPFPLTNAPTLRATVWDDCFDVRIADPNASRMLSEVLHAPAQLVWMPDDCERLTSIKRGEPRRHVSFADAAPLLLTTTAALEELNTRLQRSGSSAIPMDRFRPNVVVRGATAGADDHWRTLRIGNAAFRVSNACKRCKVITIDQSTGEFAGNDPLTTLATYRAEGPSVTFGQHMMAEASGSISVGDAVAIDARHEPLP